MVEKYKILAAMLSLREFSAQDLCRYTDVKANTVYTWINRCASLLEETGRAETGKRGGQPRRWRLKETQVEYLRAQLGSLFVGLQSAPNAIPQSEAAPEIPTGLLVAEDTLLRLYPDAETEKKQELLEFAEINFDAGRAECDNLMAGSAYTGDVEAIKAHMVKVRKLLDAHLHSIEELFVLSRLEFDFESLRQKKPTVDVQDLYRKLTDVSSELWKLGGELNCAHAFGTMQRVAHSPVINMALGW